MVKNKKFVSEKMFQKEEKPMSKESCRSSRSWVSPALVKSENEPLVLLKNACYMPCGNLRPWEDCLGNLKLIYAKMPLKISTFLKDNSL